MSIGVACHLRLVKNRKLTERTSFSQRTLVYLSLRTELYLCYSEQLQAYGWRGLTVPPLVPVLNGLYRI